MDTILNGLQQIEGVLGALAIDGSGQVVAHKAHTVYDAGLLRQVSRLVTNAVESIQLLHEDWDGMSVNFADGKLLLRNLGGKGGPPKNGLLTLAVIADSRLNPSFAGVAIRVAVQKLKTAVVGPASPAGGVAVAGVAAPSPGLVPQPAMTFGSSSAFAASPMTGVAASKSDIAGSGLSWSGIGNSSGMEASGVAVADASSATYLTAFTKVLAMSIGPMAKAFVKEAIRKLWPDRPFSRDLGPLLASELERHIDDRDELIRFRKAVRSL